VFSVVQFSSTVWYFYEIHGVKKVNAGALRGGLFPFTEALFPRIIIS
jgi:hypothetical protein